MNAAKLAQMNAMHMERKGYEEPSPQMGSLPPPPTTLAHQRFLKQMQRHYSEGRPDIAREPDEPLDLGKERHDKEPADPGDQKDAKEKDYFRSYEDRARANGSEQEQDASGADEPEYSDDEHKHASS